MRFKERRGFTFIEVMVTAAILSLVGLVLGAAVNNGITIWNKVNNIMFAEDMAVFSDKITLDIKNTIRYKGIDFGGDEESISIPTLVKGGFSAPVPGRITYNFSKSKMEIEKVEEDYSDVFEGRRPGGKVLLTGVTSAVFTYYMYNKDLMVYEWVKSVNEGIPSAVRVAITLDIKGKSSDYAKTIDVPVGKREFQEK